MTLCSAHLSTSDLSRTIEVEWHLCILSGPPPSAKSWVNIAGCLKWCLVHVQFLTLQGYRLPQLSWETCSFLLSHLQQKGYFCLNGISHISICAHYHLFIHWAPLRTAWLHLHYSFLLSLYHSFSSDIYTHIHQHPCLFFKLLISWSVLKNYIL